MKVESDVHIRRRGCNFGVLAVLLGFIVIIFMITVVKVREGGFSQAFDHVLRPELIEGQTGEGAQ